MLLEVYIMLTSIAYCLQTATFRAWWRLASAAGSLSGSTRWGDCRSEEGLRHFSSKTHTQKVQAYSAKMMQAERQEMPAFTCGKTEKQGGGKCSQNISHWLWQTVTEYISYCYRVKAPRAYISRSVPISVWSMSPWYRNITREGACNSIGCFSELCGLSEEMEQRYCLVIAA